LLVDESKDFGIDSGLNSRQLIKRIDYDVALLDQAKRDLADDGRRLGGALRVVSLPPRSAKRRALSRSMSALSASRTRFDFSISPVRA
jgi:hypothetical protein